MSDHSPAAPFLSRTLLSGEVARFIRREIISRRLQPGDHLVETDFAERLQVSKSPVREAFRILEAEGLIVSHPHRGSFVARLDKRDTWELDTLRALLEPFAAQLAVARIDAEGIALLDDLVAAMAGAADEFALSDLHARFHETVTRYSGHKRIVEIVAGLWSQMNLVLTLTRFGHLQAEVIQRDHRLLLDALKERDAAKTRVLFEEHIYRTLPGLLDSLQAEPR